MSPSASMSLVWGCCAGAAGKSGTSAFKGLKTAFIKAWGNSVQCHNSSLLCPSPALQQHHSVKSPRTKDKPGRLFIIIFSYIKQMERSSKALLRQEAKATRWSFTSANASSSLGVSFHLQLRPEQADLTPPPPRRTGSPIKRCVYEAEHSPYFHTPEPKATVGAERMCGQSQGQLQASPALRDLSATTKAPDRVCMARHYCDPAACSSRTAEWAP